MSDQTPIPGGVYYDPHFDNFLTADGDGMGVKFWTQWTLRCHEFPAFTQPIPIPPRGTPDSLRLENDRLIEQHDAAMNEVERVTGIAGLLRLDNAALIASLRDMLDCSDEPPEANCSCHISPPCNDCIDYGMTREVRATARAVLKSCRETLKTPEAKLPDIEITP